MKSRLKNLVFHLLDCILYMMLSEMFSRPKKSKPILTIKIRL